MSRFVLLAVYPECTEDQFECSNKRCIPNSWVCNGLTDCPDRADEKNCGTGNQTRCSKDQFECQNLACIDNRLLCDSNDDCGDFSDEESCSEYPDIPLSAVPPFC